MSYPVTVKLHLSLLRKVASVLKTIHLLLAYWGALPSPSPKWVWLGAGHPAVICPRALQLWGGASLELPK